MSASEGMILVKSTFSIVTRMYKTPTVLGKRRRDGFFSHRNHEKACSAMQTEQYNGRHWQTNGRAADKYYAVVLALVYAGDSTSAKKRGRTSYRGMINYPVLSRQLSIALLNSSRGPSSPQ